MQELNRHTPQATEMHAVAQARRQKVILGKLRPKPGQKVWECNMANGQIAECEEEAAEARLNKDGSARVVRNIKVKDNHLYCVAINRENAERKFIKQVETILGIR